MRDVGDEGDVKRCGCNKAGCWSCYLDEIRDAEPVHPGKEGWIDEDIDNIMFIVKVPARKLVPTDQGVSETQVVAWGVNHLMRQIGTLLQHYGFTYTLWYKKRPK